MPDNAPTTPTEYRSGVPVTMTITTATEAEDEQKQLAAEAEAEEQALGVLDADVWAYAESLATGPARSRNVKKSSRKAVNVDTNHVERVDDANLDALRRRVTHEHLGRLRMTDRETWPTMVETGDNIIRLLDAHYAVWKQKRGGNMAPPTLNPRQIAEIVLTYHEVAVVLPTPETNRENGLLYLYDPETVTWDVILSEVSRLQELAADLVYGIDTRGLREYVNYIRLLAEVREDNADPHDVYYKNCIFNYLSRERRDYTKDDLVTYRLRVSLPEEKPDEPVFHHGKSFRDCEDPDTCEAHGCCVWTIHGGMRDWFGDEAHAGWSVLGANIRSRHLFRQAVFALGEGSNGKSTFLNLNENMHDPRTVANTSINDMTSRFGGALLIGKSAVISHEANATHIKDAAVLKALISHDPVQLEDKGKTPVNVRVRAFVIQAANEMPRFSDKTPALADRFYPLHFVSRYKDSKYKLPEVDAVYVHDPKLWDYIAWYTTYEMEPFYELPQTAGVKESVHQLRGDIDKTLPWWEELAPRLKGDALPFPVLYEHYREWTTRQGPNSKPESMTTEWMNRVARHAADTWSDIMEEGTRQRAKYNTTAFFLSPVTKSDGSETLRAHDEDVFGEYFQYDDDRGLVGSATLAAWCSPDGEAHDGRQVVKRPARVTGLVRTSTWEAVKERGGRTADTLRKMRAEIEDAEHHGERTGRSLYQLMNPEADTPTEAAEVTEAPTLEGGDQSHHRTELEDTLLKWYTAPPFGAMHADWWKNTRVIAGKARTLPEVVRESYVRSDRYHRDGGTPVSPLDHHPSARAEGARKAATEWSATPGGYGLPAARQGVKTIDGQPMDFSYLTVLRSVQAYQEATSARD